MYDSAWVVRPEYFLENKLQRDQEGEKVVGVNIHMCSCNFSKFLFALMNTSITRIISFN